MAAANPNGYAPWSAHPPGFKLINGISRHIARIQRSFHKALDTLRKLQAERRKEAARASRQPVDTPAEPASTPSKEPPKQKNAYPTHACGDEIPRKGVESVTNAGIEADGAAPPDLPKGS